MLEIQKMEKAEIEEWIEYVNGQTAALEGKMYDQFVQDLYIELVKEYEEKLDETGLLRNENSALAGELKEKLHEAFHNFDEAVARLPKSGGYNRSRKNKNKNRSRKQTQRRQRRQRSQRKQKKRQTRNRK